MIRGLDIFKAYFSDFTQEYVLIGGSAASLLMEEAGLSFRATKDLDIVLCIEAFNSEFANKLWSFIKAGGYKNQQKSTGKKIFYRFSDPDDDQFPFMLEIFSRAPNKFQLKKDSHLTPIPSNDDISSLSAILLDENAYHFLQENKIVISGVSVITEACLIPLKVNAWFDLTRRKNSGEKIDSKMIKKHRNDVFRVFQMLSPALKVSLPENLASDMDDFYKLIVKDKSIRLKEFGLEGFTVRQIVDILKDTYGVTKNENSN